jgi:hypothetical protein
MSSQMMECYIMLCNWSWFSKSPPVSQYYALKEWSQAIRYARMCELLLEEITQVGLELRAAQPSSATTAANVEDDSLSSIRSLRW